MKSSEKTKTIAGREHLSADAAAKFLGCCRSTFDVMVAKSARGLLKPPLRWFRTGPRSPLWFDREHLAEWVEERTEAAGEDEG